VSSLATGSDHSQDHRDSTTFRDLDPSIGGQVTESRLADLCAAVTGTPAPDRDQVLFLESLEATDLRSRLEVECGVSLPLEDLLGEFSVRSLAGRAETALAEQAGSACAGALHPDLDARYEPFPLTDIQQAYLLGRSGAFELGNVSTHFYVEFDQDGVDIPRLSEALRLLIDRHDMLRAVIHPDGLQQILPEVEPYQVEVTDLRGLAAREADVRLTAVRERMSHQILPAGEWPLFEICAHQLDEHRSRLHVSIDLLIADGASIALLFGEWSQLYEDLRAPLGPLDVSFRDYVVAVAERTGTGHHQADRDYWRHRLPSLPHAPELPYVPAGGGRRDRFTRRSRTFDQTTWSALKARAEQAGVTPSALLLTTYTDVLARWSRNPSFTVNVTVGERLGLHPHVPALVGDFTSSILFAVEPAADDHSLAAGGFDARAQRTQRRLREDLAHAGFNGVSVLREMARAGNGAPVGMPVVFTSMLGMDRPGSDAARLFDQPGFAVSQTPQVLLDYQAVGRSGRLEVSWDAVDDRFMPGVLDAMFAAYCRLLERLAGGGETGGLIPADQSRRRNRLNDTGWEEPERLLHAPIDRWVRERPDATAVVATGRTLTYRELDRAANQIARLVRAHGVEPNQLVAVIMNKGWQQIVAVLGILRAGAAYIPVDAALPAARVRQLLDIGEVQLALTQSQVAEDFAWPPGVAVESVDAPHPDVDDSPVGDGGNPDDLAYVIFTSGSTGEPKGVMIRHRSAVNTVMDVNERFGIGPEDRVLAVSSLSFDLSVYDIFGLLAAGGTIVIPDAAAERDPAGWASLIAEHGVTIWNSVPALLGLIVDYAGGRADRLGQSLRLALLSGDWVPLELPDQIRSLIPAIEVVSLGGATEGSIWSILYPIGKVDAAWTSIPYGMPMRGQQMHVLDARLRPRPDSATGEIYIGGAGVAAGYWRDAAKTATSVVRRPGTNEPIYRTGDLGRQLPDGTIEFLGREDSQVKIRGHRVELGEIENVLAAHPDVGTVAIVAVGGGEGRGRQSPNRIVAHYTRSGDSDPAAGELTALATERLPDYMVPVAFIGHDALPLTGNGKVDRAALAAATDPAALRPGAQRDRTGGRSHNESTLAAIWQDVLGVPPGDDDDFFAAGGDSLQVLRFVARAGAAGIGLRTEDFFTGATFGDLLQHAGTPTALADQGMVTGDVDLTPNQLWFLGQNFADMHQWNGMWPLLSVGENIDPSLLGGAVHRLLVHHDALRMRFRQSPQGWRAVIEGPGAALPVPFSTIDLSDVPDADLGRIVEKACARLQASLDLERGPLVRVTYLDLGPDRPARLHVAAHWIALDYYSSRVFFTDLQGVYEQLRTGVEPALPPKTTSVVEFGRRLREQAQAADIDDEIAYWLEPARRAATEIPLDYPAGVNDQGSAQRLLASLGQDETVLLTEELPRRYRCEVREILLLALGRALLDWTGRETHVIDVEGHGREGLADQVDMSRTVARTSTQWPLLLRVPTGSRDESMAETIEQVRRPRDHGVWYGMLRYLRHDAGLRESLADLPPASVGFNYWGRVDEYFTERIWPSSESPGQHRSDAGHRPRPLDVLSFVAGGELGLVWSYSSNLHGPDTVRRLAERTMAELVSILHDGSGPGLPAPTASPIDENRPLQLDGRWRLSGLTAPRSE
jgi:amino acid adenylation domain-containing protein/non-ribosomal peptide synthase protein (TIGR01720 family)